MGYKPHFFLGDGSKGLPQFGPYDRIIVTAGAPSVPKPMLDQLNPLGRMIIPTGDHERQAMLLITKDADGNLIEKNYGDFAFVPLRGTHGWS